ILVQDIRVQRLDLDLVALRLLSLALNENRSGLAGVIRLPPHFRLAYVGDMRHMAPPHIAASFSGQLPPTVDRPHAMTWIWEAWDDRSGLLHHPSGWTLALWVLPWGTESCRSFRAR